MNSFADLRVIRGKKKFRGLRAVSDMARSPPPFSPCHLVFSVLNSRSLMTQPPRIPLSAHQMGADDVERETFATMPEFNPAGFRPKDAV